MGTPLLWVRYRGRAREHPRCGSLGLPRRRRDVAAVHHTPGAPLSLDLNCGMAIPAATSLVGASEQHWPLRQWKTTTGRWVLKAEAEWAACGASGAPKAGRAAR